MDWTVLCPFLVILIISLHVRDSHTFKCRSSILVTTYILDAFVCDGESDCYDGSDEEIQACLSYGKRPSGCHCKDPKDCNAHNTGYCKECMEHYYGASCEFYSEKTCHCALEFDCKFYATCVCEDSSWQGNRCEDPKPTQFPETHKHGGIGAGSIVAIVATGVFLAVASVCCRCIYRKRQRAINNDRLRQQQRENFRQVHILVISAQSQEDIPSSGAGNTNRSFQANPEDSTRPPSYEPPPSYDCLQDTFSYPVAGYNQGNLNDTGRQLEEHHRSVNTTFIEDCGTIPSSSDQRPGVVHSRPDVHYDLPSYESLRR